MNAEPYVEITHLEAIPRGQAGHDFEITGNFADMTARIKADAKAYGLSEYEVFLADDEDVSLEWLWYVWRIKLRLPAQPLRYKSNSPALTRKSTHSGHYRRKPKQSMTTEPQGVQRRV